MRAVAFCLLALVVAASARELHQVTALDCKTESQATLNLQGSGEGFAQSKAYCEAEADAQKVIKEVLREYFEVFDGDSSKGQCTEAKASEAVTAVAKAIASAYTSVTTKVEIQGTGEACASGFAAGDALAISLVSISLDLTVDLIEEKYPTTTYGQDVKKAVDEKHPPKVDSASGQAKGSAIAAAIATAWSAAAADACTTGGFEEDFEEAFVKSTTVAVAELWATVIVELCSNFEDADTEGLKEWAEKTSNSFSEIGGEVTVEGDTEVKTTDGATGSGEATEIPPCTGSKGICCSANSISLSSCSCGSGCSMDKETGRTEGQAVWKDGAGTLCLCA